MKEAKKIEKDKPQLRAIESYKSIPTSFKLKDFKSSSSNHLINNDKKQSSIVFKSELN